MLKASKNQQVMNSQFFYIFSTIGEAKWKPG